MTVRKALRMGTLFLAETDSESPNLDANLLLAFLLGIRRSDLIIHALDPLSESHLSQFRTLLARRGAGEPIAYILGYKEFWGKDFIVDPRVLVPRPETEHLVEVALEVARGFLRPYAGTDPPSGGTELLSNPLRIHDSYTGSGCVGIAIALELKRLFPETPCSMSFSDISLQAIEVARENYRRILGKEGQTSKEGQTFIQSDCLSQVPGPFDIITANPPYLADNEMADVRKSGRNEPETALSGGKDGLDLYRVLIPQARDRLFPGGWLLLEIGWQQADAVSALFQGSGFEDVSLLKDLAGRDRVMIGRIPCRRT